MARHRMGVGAVGVLVQVHYVDANGGQVIDIQKLAFGCTCSPDRDVFCSATLPREFVGSVQE